MAICKFTKTFWNIQNEEKWGKKKKKKKVCIEIIYPQSIYKNLNSTDTQYHKRMNIKKIYGLFFILKKKRTRDFKRNVFGQFIRFWKVGKADNFSAPFLVYSNIFILFEPRFLCHK